MGDGDGELRAQETASDDDNLLVGRLDERMQLLEILNRAEGGDLALASALENRESLGDTAGGQEDLAVLEDLAVVQGKRLLGNVEILDSSASQQLDAALGRLNLLQCLLIN